MYCTVHRRSKLARVDSTDAQKLKRKIKIERTFNALLRTLQNERMYGYTAVKMQVVFWDLPEVKQNGLKLQEWCQNVKTDDVNSPWSPQDTKFKSLKNTMEWKFWSKKDHLSKCRFINHWIIWPDDTSQVSFLIILLDK